MTISTKKLPDVQNLKNTGTAFIDLPKGDTYHNILCMLGGTDFDRSHIKRVRVMLNGKPFIRDISAADLHALNLFRLSADDADKLLIDFEEPRSRTFEEQMAATIGTAAGVNSFRIEFDIEGATSPEMTLYARTSGPRALGIVPAIIQREEDFVSVGTRTIEFPYALGPKVLADGRPGPGAGHIIKRAHFCLSGGLTIEELTLYKNGIPVKDRMVPAVASFFQRHYEDVPQSNWFTVDLVEDNNTLLNLLPTEDASSLYWQVKNGHAGHLTTIYELLSPLEGV